MSGHLPHGPGWSVVERLDEAVPILSRQPDGPRIVCANRAFAAATGFPVAAARGRHPGWALA